MSALVACLCALWLLIECLRQALAWWALGVRNVTSTLGRSTLPTDLKALLTARKIRSVAVAFRRDDDGDTDIWVGALNEIVIHWIYTGTPDLETAAPEIKAFLLRSIGAGNEK